MAFCTKRYCYASIAEHIIFFAKKIASNRFARIYWVRMKAILFNIEMAFLKKEKDKN